jgi:hypothetical protein
MRQESRRIKALLGHDPSEERKLLVRGGHLGEVCLSGHPQHLPSADRRKSKGHTFKRGPHLQCMGVHFAKGGACPCKRAAQRDGDKG